MSKTRCDSCPQDAVGIYVLSDYPNLYSFLCYDHGSRYLSDAADNGLEAHQMPLSSVLPGKEMKAY
jgi:hypothetical protein